MKKLSLVFWVFVAFLLICMYSCKKAEMEQMEQVDQQVPLVEETAQVDFGGTRGWVNDSWYYYPLSLSKSFSIGPNGLSVSGYNQGGASVCVYIQQRDSNNNWLWEDYFQMSANGGTGTYSNYNLEPGVDNILITVVRTGGGLNVSGALTISSNY